MAWRYLKLRGLIVGRLTSRPGCVCFTCTTTTSGWLVVLVHTTTATSPGSWPFNNASHTCPNRAIHGARAAHAARCGRAPTPSSRPRRPCNPAFVTRSPGWAAGEGRGRAALHRGGGGRAPRVATRPVRLGEDIPSLPRAARGPSPVWLVSVLKTQASRVPSCKSPNRRRARGTDGARACARVRGGGCRALAASDDADGAFLPTGRSLH